MVARREGSADDVATVLPEDHDHARRAIGDGGHRTVRDGDCRTFGDGGYRALGDGGRRGTARCGGDAALPPQPLGDGGAGAPGPAEAGRPPGAQILGPAQTLHECLLMSRVDAAHSRSLSTWPRRGRRTRTPREVGRGIGTTSAGTEPRA